MQRKRAQLEYTGGHVRYGYRVAPDGVSLIADEAEQAVIQAIAELRAKGLSLRRVAEQLEARGFLSRTGRAFKAQSIANIERDAEQAP